MRKIISSILLTLVFLGNTKGQSIELPWMLNYKDALATVSDDKLLLISFAGSDWCKPCIMLTREVFETEEFNSYARDNLVLLLADFPRLKKNKLSDEQSTENDQIAQRFNQEGVFPSVVVVDKNENIIGKLGYTPGGPDVIIKKLKALANTK